MDPTLYPTPYMPNVPNSFASPSPFNMNYGGSTSMNFNPQQSMAAALGGTQPPWLGANNAPGPGTTAEQFGGSSPYSQQSGGFTNPQSPS